MKYSLTVVALFLTFGIYAQQTPKDSISAEQLDEVLVRAVRVDADSPITHSNLDAEDLEDRNLGQDIPILLNYLPNVVTTSDAGAGVGYTGIRVRGSDASRVNVTLNGIPYNDAESQGTFWVNMPDFSSSVESLQLQRGVGTSVNGSGAFGASLNILTDEVRQQAYGELSGSVGSFNTYRYHAKFSTGLMENGFEFAGRLSQIQSDGYIDRASSDLNSYFFQAAYKDENTLIKAITFAGHELTYQAYFGIDAETLETDRTFNPAGLYTDEDGNVQFYDNEVDDYRQDHYQLHWNQRFSNRWSSNLSLNYTYGRGFFEQYREDEDFADYDLEPITLGMETINTTDLIRRRWLDNDYYVISGNLNYKDTAWDVTGGLFYSTYTGDHFGEIIWARYASNSEIRERYYEGVGDKNEFSAFAKATFRLNENWSFYGDLQGRFITYTTDGLTSDRVPLEVDEDFAFFNPKAGVTYTLDAQNQFYASYARANREPNRNDFENGSPRPEQLNDYELGWRYQQNKTAFTANLYYMQYKDQLVLTGAIDDVGAPLRTNSGESYRLGLELTADVPLGNQFRWMPNLALSTNKNKDFFFERDGVLTNLGNTNISYSPEVVAGSMLIYQPFSGFQVGLLSKFVGEQYLGNIDSPNSILDSFFVNDLNVSYEWKTAPFVERILFTGLINNIFDEQYVSNGYFFTFDDDFSVPGEVTTVEGAGYYPQAGINFLVGATISF
ncbi:TonB-dependent receptor [Croceiramulus getboli]|nr:TonB-dependent receptor [Flavobacteriaceae bacterium YJPT1-3]